jgi:hypothetical protein
LRLVSGWDSMTRFRVLITLIVFAAGSVSCGEVAIKDVSGDSPVLSESTLPGSPASSDSPISPSSTLGDSIVGPPDSDWNWQLSGVLDMSVDVAVWDVDLFETPADVIAELQADGRYVICYFSAGSIEDWRPDVGGIEDSAIGFPLDDWPG